MQTFAAIAAGLFGVLIVFTLTKNVGTSTKAETGLGEVTSALVTITGDITGS